MSNVKTFLKSGHPPTLFASFLYFDFCFAIWVLNGAMAPFISETFNLSPVQKGFMISVPILAGALMRFPLGVLSQYIGRKNAALFEMSVIVLAMAFGYFFVDTYNACSRWECCSGSPERASESRCRSVRAGSHRSTRGLRWGWPGPVIAAPCWPCYLLRRSRPSTVGRRSTVSPG